MADYLMNAKDDQTYVSTVEEKTVLKPITRYGNLGKTADDRVESLDRILFLAAGGDKGNFNESARDSIEAEMKPLGALLERENRSPYKKYIPKITRPKYDDNGNLVRKGDDTDLEGNEVPFMRDLWDAIDTYQRRLDMYDDKIEADEFVLSHPKTAYSLQKLRHFLIEVKRSQFYLKDTYNPEVRLLGVSHDHNNAINWSSDSGLWLTKDEWLKRAENRKTYDLKQKPLDETPYDPATDKYFWAISYNSLDYENPRVMLKLLQNYKRLLERSYPHPDSELRLVCWDVERFVEESNLDDLELFLVRALVAHYNIEQIQKVIIPEGYALTDHELSVIMRTKIPRKLAVTAKRNRLTAQMNNGEVGGRVCGVCKRKMPLHVEYFYHDYSRRDGYSCMCKECTRKARQRKKEMKENAINREIKAMPEM